jgi:hypothetical protein
MHLGSVDLLSPENLCTQERRVTHSGKKQYLLGLPLTLDLIGIGAIPAVCALSVGRRGDEDGGCGRSTAAGCAGRGC